MFYAPISCDLFMHEDFIMCQSNFKSLYAAYQKNFCFGEYLITVSSNQIPLHSSITNCYEYLRCSMLLGGYISLLTEHQLAYLSLLLRCRADSSIYAAEHITFMLLFFITLYICIFQYI